MLARFSFYVSEAATTAATADFAEALHQLGEGIGLALGFHGLENPAAGPLAGGARVVTDAEIEAMMTTIGVDMADLGASTTGELVVEQNFAAQADDIEEALDATALDVDLAETQGWAAPTPG